MAGHLGKTLVAPMAGHLGMRGNMHDLSSCVVDQWGIRMCVYVQVCGWLGGWLGGWEMSAWAGVRGSVSVSGSGFGSGVWGLGLGLGLDMGVGSDVGA
eukprot:7836682-Alexandrium_andersonii.AAC.1